MWCFGLKRRSRRIGGQQVGMRSLAGRRRAWIWVCYEGLSAHWHFERGLGQAMLRVFYGRQGRRLLGRLAKTLQKFGVYGKESGWIDDGSDSRNLRHGPRAEVEVL